MLLGSVATRVLEPYRYVPMHVKTEDEWRRQAPSLLEALREFGGVMRSQPFQNREGLRGVSAFALYWFLRQLTPTLVIEV